MYLHLGQNTVVNMKDIVGVFEMDNSTVSKHTRNYLTRAQKEHRVVNVSMELPKSFIVCREARPGDRVSLADFHGDFAAQGFPAEYVREIGKAG